MPPRWKSRWGSREVRVEGDRSLYGALLALPYPIRYIGQASFLFSTLLAVNLGTLVPCFRFSDRTYRSRVYSDIHSH